MVNSHLFLPLPHFLHCNPLMWCSLLEIFPLFVSFSNRKSAVFSKSSCWLLLPWMWFVASIILESLEVRIFNNLPTEVCSFGSLYWKNSDAIRIFCELRSACWYASKPQIYYYFNSALSSLSRFLHPLVYCPYLNCLDCIGIVLCMPPFHS